jgi:multiple sugar transport system permease protein
MATATATSLRSRLQQKRARRKIGNVAAFLVASVIGLLFFIPFAWMVSTSLKDISEVYAFPPKFLPKVLKWSNYSDAWHALPFNVFFLNSIFVAVVTTVGVVLTSSMAGYSFARLRYPGRDKLFLAYLGTLMIPFPVLMVPLFVIMKNLQLVDNLWSLILPAIFTPAGTFLMRQFILTLPRELEESARVDGCGFFGIYWRIVLPLMKPVLATLAIFTFLGSWNEFLWPLITISSIENKTLPLGLTMFQSRVAGRTPWDQVMASATFTIIPVLIVFILGQKYYVRGIVTTGIKG